MQTDSDIRMQYKLIKNILLATVILSVFRTAAATADDNPFMAMINQPYSVYSQELHDNYLEMAYLDTIEWRRTVRQLEEVAQKMGSMEWKLHAERIELELFIRRHQLDGAEPFPADYIINKEFELLQKAEKAGILRMEIAFRHMIIDFYRFQAKNYELAFEQCTMQEERLQRISTDDCPEKALFYIPIANVYYFFKEYGKAMSIFSKILEEKENTRNQLAQQSARNGVGLCYRYAYNDLDRSDSCFQAIMQVVYIRPEESYYRENWEGVAEGNIGYNMLLRGAYDEAIPLLKSSIDKMLKYGDFAYASGSAINLADIYLKKGNPSEAKKYIEIAGDYNRRLPREGRQSRIFEVMSKYYATTGNPKLSIAYMDSTVMATKTDEARFNALQLMRVEQRRHLSEQKEKEEQLYTEKLKSDNYLKIGITFFAMLLLVCGILFYTIVLYRRKKAAHHDLANKLQAWAQAHTEIIKPDRQTRKTLKALPDETDFLIMQEIERLMTEQAIYKDAALSLDSLAQRLQTNRNYVSAAINRCTGKNYSAYFNEYRVKEAIRLLSINDIRKYSIDRIAIDAGFTDRYNLYRVFKNMTGLSPTEFLQKLGAKVNPD